MPRFCKAKTSEHLQIFKNIDSFSKTLYPINMKQMYVYILTNRNNTTLYIGVTNNLPRRILEHKNKILKGFTDQYEISKLVYFEIFTDEKTAIEREKYLKKCYRKTKEKLINSKNPTWSDLSDSFL